MNKIYTYLYQGHKIAFKIDKKFKIEGDLSAAIMVNCSQFSKILGSHFDSFLEEGLPSFKKFKINNMISTIEVDQDQLNQLKPYIWINLIIGKIIADKFNNSKFKYWLARRYFDIANEYAFYISKKNEEEKFLQNSQFDELENLKKKLKI